MARAVPVQYVIDPAGARIRTTCTGFVTLADVLDHFDTLERDPACLSRLDVLLDLRAVTSLPEPTQLRAAAMRIQGVTRVTFRLLAIAVESDVWFGLARMFEAYSEPHFEEIRVFRDIDGAEAWLDAASAARRSPP